MAIQKEYTPYGLVILSLFMIGIITSSFFGYSFFYQEPKIKEDISITISDGIVYYKFFEKIEDGLEIGIILTESLKDTHIYIFMSNLEVGELDKLSKNELISTVKNYEEFQDKTEVYYKAKDYRYNTNIIFYFDNPNNIGEEVAITYFTQRGSLSSRTGAFIISFFVYSIFIAFLYLPNKRQIAEYRMDKRIQKAIERGEIKPISNDMAKNRDDIIDSIFTK